jgi:hypothetical protein
VLSLFVLLSGLGVLRARELYADARVLQWRASVDPLRRALGLLAPMRGIRTLLHLHPTPARRMQAATDPRLLFLMTPWEGLAAGLAATVILRNVWMLVGAFMNSSPYPALIPTVCALLAIPVALGIVGIGIWRDVFHSASSDRKPRQRRALAWGLGLGLFAGEALSFQEMVQPSDRTWLASTVWGAAVLVASHVCLRWVESCASVWIRHIPKRPSALRPAYLVGLALAGVIFSHVFGSAMVLRSAVSQNSSFVDALLILGGFSYAGMLSIVPSLTLFVLWAYPFASVFATRTPMPIATDAEQAPTLPSLRDAARPALRVSLLFFGTLLLLHLFIQLFVPPGVQDLPAFNMVFFWGRIALCALGQTLCAVRLSRSVREWPLLHGLASAFIASVLMTGAWLAARWVFRWGNSFDIHFTFVNVANFGALIALPTALLAAHARKPPSQSAMDHEPRLKSPDPGLDLEGRHPAVPQ